MLHERLTAPTRAPGAHRIGVASVKGRRLAFHKASIDGSGKCDIPDSADPNEMVFGVVYDVPASEMAALGRAEGVGHGYRQLQLTVMMENAVPTEAIAYVGDGTRVDTALLPYTWYLAVVIAGAEQQKLPAGYRAKLAKQPAVEDPKQDRPTRVEAETALRTYHLSGADVRAFG